MTNREERRKMEKAGVDVDAVKQMEAQAAKEAEWLKYRQGVVDAVNVKTENCSYEAKVGFIQALGSEMMLTLARAQAKRDLEEALENLGITKPAPADGGESAA